LALVALTNSVGASRIQVHDVDLVHAKFGASCEDLQNTFKSRLDAFQDFLDANPDLDAIGRAAQARTMMRTYGIIRTLRRARTCSWVVDNDSEELERARSIVHTLLAGNPCADLARAELQGGVAAESGELELQAVQRAMSVLNSDDCAAPEQPEEPSNLDENDVDAALSTAEDELQDVIEGLEDSGGAAFLQTDEGLEDSGIVRRFFRAVGVAFLMIFLLLACVGGMAAIGMLMVGLIGQLVTSGNFHRSGGLEALKYYFVGGLAAGAIGIAPCAYQLYTQLLPQLTGSNGSH